MLDRRFLAAVALGVVAVVAGYLVAGAVGVAVGVVVGFVALVWAVRR